MTAAVLEAEGLCKRHGPRAAALFGRRPVAALQDVGLALAPGEAVGLVGASGAGKSTLARVLARLDLPDAGRLRIEGQDVGHLSPARFARHPLRRRVQMVFQDAPGSIAPWMTARQAIADPLEMFFPRDPANPDRVAAAAQAALLSPDLLDRPVRSLSQGQQARVGIARAIAPEPAVLLLDEPTAALDASVQAGILLALDGLRRRRGVALVFITHDLHLVRLLCDRMLVLDAGRIVESGLVADLLTAPRHAATAALVAAMPGQGRHRV